MYMLSFQAVGKRSRAEQAPRVRFTSPPPSPPGPCYQSSAAQSPTCGAPLPAPPVSLTTANYPLLITGAYPL